VAAQLMRRILVDFARARHQDKRGGGARQVSLYEAAEVSVERAAEFIALDEALDRLVAIDPRRSRMVELRFFGGLSEEETAEALKVSPRTVRREWSLARAWLHRESRRGSREAWMKPERWKQMGAGGMGEVYLARDTRPGREIALKMLPAELTTDADCLRRFEQEARSVRAQSSQHHHHF
jgi:hypothetical protein